MIIMSTIKYKKIRKSGQTTTEASSISYMAHILYIYTQYVCFVQVLITVTLQMNCIAPNSFAGTISLLNFSYIDSRQYIFQKQQHLFEIKRPAPS